MSSSSSTREWSRVLQALKGRVGEKSQVDGTGGKGRSTFAALGIFAGEGGTGISYGRKTLYALLFHFMRSISFIHLVH